MRLVDADALIKDIAESIRLADEWEKESHEKKDKNGLKYAIDTRRSLLSMIFRVKEAPTIDAEPVRHGRWIPRVAYEELSIAYCDYACSECGREITKRVLCVPPRCENCGAKMDGGE